MNQEYVEWRDAAEEKLARPQPTTPGLGLESGTSSGSSCGPGATVFIAARMLTDERDRKIVALVNELERMEVQA